VQVKLGLQSKVGVAKLAAQFTFPHAYLDKSTVADAAPGLGTPARSAPPLCSEGPRVVTTSLPRLVTGSPAAVGVKVAELAEDIPSGGLFFLALEPWAFRMDLGPGFPKYVEGGT
jgi:hypothetical protein